MCWNFNYIFSHFFIDSGLNSAATTPQFMSRCHLILTSAPSLKQLQLPAVKPSTDHSALQNIFLRTVHRPNKEFLVIQSYVTIVNGGLNTKGIERGVRNMSKVTTAEFIIWVSRV